MYTEDQIRAAACGKSAAQGGLNLPDIKKILTASGLSTSGNGDAVRATLKENLDTCLAQQGLAGSPVPRSATERELFACTYSATPDSSEPNQQTTMYMESQIRNAAAGKSHSAKGLNLDDVDKILSDAGLPTNGLGPERRQRL